MSDEQHGQESDDVVDAARRLVDAVAAERRYRHAIPQHEGERNRLAVAVTSAMYDVRAALDPDYVIPAQELRFRAVVAELRGESVRHFRGGGEPRDRSNADPRSVGPSAEGATNVDPRFRGGSESGGLG